MKVDAIRLDLRPRGMFEAADLGVRLVAAHRRAVWATCGPAYALVLALAGAAMPFGVVWAVLVVIWLKPWLDRSILFVLARAVFGEDTGFIDWWTARRAIAGQGLLGALTMRRLSPWRAYVQPVLQLEGQTGKERRERVGRMLGPHRGAALGVQSAFATLESALTLGLVSLIAWFAPGEEQARGLALLLSGQSWIVGAELACFAVAVAIVEPFFVGAGFAMYLNRRVELEAWDIEQEFRLAFAR
jgi:hypothetical protein